MQKEFEFSTDIFSQKCKTVRFDHYETQVFILGYSLKFD
jgi:hypothetical protein